MELGSAVTVVLASRLAVPISTTVYSRSYHGCGSMQWRRSRYQLENDCVVLLGMAYGITLPWTALVSAILMSSLAARPNQL